MAVALFEEISKLHSWTVYGKTLDIKSFKKLLKPIYNVLDQEEFIFNE